MVIMIERLVLDLELPLAIIMRLDAMKFEHAFLKNMVLLLHFGLSTILSTFLVKQSIGRNQVAFAIQK